MTRWELFKGHWKQLRETGKEYGNCGWHGYNRWNCFWWALSNSKTHDLEGNYINGAGGPGVESKRR